MYSMHIYIYIYIYDTCFHRCTYLNCHIFIIRMSVCCIITVTIKYVYIYIILFIKSISKYTTWAISLSKQKFRSPCSKSCGSRCRAFQLNTHGRPEQAHALNKSIRIASHAMIHVWKVPASKTVPAQHVALHAFFAFFCLPWAEKYTTLKRGSDRVQALNQFNPAVHICPFIDVKSIAGYKYYQITNVIKSMCVV